MSAKAAYSGRLAFDPESGFHTEVIPGRPYDGEIVFNREAGSLTTKGGEPVVSDDGGATWRVPDLPGKPVVTEDGGKTWRFAKDGDPSHVERYHERYVTVDSTANKFAELAFKHGEDQAAELIEPHHFEAQPDDAHYDESADGKSTPKFHPDEVAPTVTSHTDAYTEDAA